LATKKRKETVAPSVVAAYSCAPCIQMRCSDGMCMRHKVIPAAICGNYDAIAGRHELHRKIIGE
jgi:hypothetical protein